MLARAPPVPPDPPGRHKGAPLGRWSRLSAPQAVAGTLGDGQWKAETADVPAERHGWTRTAPEAAWEALGRHVGPAGGPVGAAKVGLIVR